MQKMSLFWKVCNTPAYLSAYAEYFEAATALGDQINRTLAPRTGKGWSLLDMNALVPTFLRTPSLEEFSWPDRGTWGFGGDPSVPHHISIEETSVELLTILGEEQFSRLVAFGEAMRDSIGQLLPEEERFRMRERGVSLGLDLADIRVENGLAATPGGRIHIDWERGEAMVLVLPLDGDHPRIYPDLGRKPCNDGHVGYLLTGLGRWETFHSPNEKKRRSWVTINEYDDPVRLPKGLVRYRDERAKIVYPDLYPEYPGLLPTVHRGGSGRRKVLILTFSHMSL